MLSQIETLIKEKESVEGPIEYQYSKEISTKPIATNANVIRVIQEHGENVIAELDHKIKDLEEKMRRHIQEKDTIKKLVQIVKEHNAKN